MRAVPDGQACPACGAEGEPGQEYCLECGGRLAPGRGMLPALAGAWRARLPWYPGDWIWSALLLLVVAATAGTVALVMTDEGEPRALPIVATSDRPVPPAQRPRQATSTPAPEERTTGPGAAKRPPGRKRGELVEWPLASSAYTVVIASLPSTVGRAAATKTARKASRAGLPDVGLLDSSRYPSLHPGYFVIFSGVYESADDAASALAQAQKLGYGRAYTRQIVT
ncbi:MAG: zinc ribbon domain-containing protein [Gaiellaceae bacterium]